MKILKFFIMILLVFLLFGFDLNNNDDRIIIMSYIVQEYDNIKSISDKFNISEYTIRTSNNIFFREIFKGERILIPNKNVTLIKIGRFFNLKRLSYKFNVNKNDITIFDLDFNIIEILDDNQILPNNSIVAIKQLNNQEFIWPTSQQPYVVSGFGWRQNPTFAHHAEFHQGLDIMSRYEQIRASKSGRILFAGWLYGYGKCVIIEHVNNEKTLYAHLSSIYNYQGAYVKQGDIIGVSGSTGRSTGPHLHFEIIKNGYSENPYKYFWHGERSS